MFYAHNGRQLVRHSYIGGTVDFIFGNAALILDHSFIQLHRNTKGGIITILASGRYAGGWLCLCKMMAGQWGLCDRSQCPKCCILTHAEAGVVQPWCGAP